MVPWAAFTFYEWYEQRELAKDVAEHETLGLAREVAIQHEQIIEGARQLLTALAQIPELRKFKEGECSALLANILKKFSRYTILGSAKPNGDLYCSGLPFTSPTNFADRPYFKETLRKRDFTVGEYQIGRISGKVNLPLAYPALGNSGQVDAVIFAGLSLDWLNDVMSRSRLPQGSTVTLGNRNGTILARHPGGEKWVGKSFPEASITKAIIAQQSEGTAVAAGVDGVLRHYAFTQLRGLETHDVYVSVGIPTQAAFAEVNRAFYRDLAFLGIILSLSLAVAKVISDRSISRPVNSLLSATKRLAAGDLSARTGLPPGEGELNQLARSFDQMAESLGQNITERKRAEEDVRRNLERTQALRDIDQAISSTLDLRSVLNVLLEKIDLVLPYAATTIRLLNKDSGLLEPVACRNLDEGEWKAERWKGGRGIPNVVFDTKAPVTIGNVQTDPKNKDQEFFRKHGLVSYLGVPLIAKGEALGVISFYTKEEHEFSRQEVEFLTTVAGQAAIAIQNSLLYEQTKKQAEELKKAIAEMEISNKVKDQFLSVMSHELRTPLNVVLGYTGMLRDGMLGEIPPKQKEVLSKVINQAGDLLTLIRDILQATQIESRSVIVDLHLVNLVDLLDRLKAGYEQPLDKELTMKWDYPADLPPVITDSEKLKQILQNLIHNAIKFTANGTVTVSARVIESSPQKAGGSKQAADDLRTADRLLPISRQWVEFQVADTGIGIPKETLPIIFDKFRQVDSSETRLYGGVGLGLYIVKKLTEFLGGTVEVESEPGKGSIFTVTIPLEQ